VQHVYPWIVSGDTRIGFDLLLDPLSAVMVLVVTFVGLLIHIFSVGYMASDKGYARYFAYLNLFMASMLILVLGKSLVLAFVGWEGVGLCSYLLIGFWFSDDAKATAGRKAFVVNRIGDFGFVLGMFLLFAVVGSLDVDALQAAAVTGGDSPLVTAEVLGISLVTAATLCLFLGCIGKSAQIPLYVWLPDAMAGPTPVSALIHAATMVTAGVYLVARMNFLFALAPVTMGIVTVVGATTALMAATIGITQNDIKKVLAYSTVSQLGFMFMAVGVGAWVAAIFHLMTHAFFKACLFLGSGSVIEACHHNQDIRTMGGLKKKMPVTAMTFFISCLAISGIPIFSGFFSKDEILLHTYINETVWSPGLNYFAWTMGAVAAFCTAFYMFRLYYLTFEDKFRGDDHTWTHHVRELPIMYWPLAILAVGATFAGFLGYPHALPGHLPHVLHDFMEPVYRVSASFGGDYFIGPKAEFVHDGHVSAGVEYAFMGISVLIAIIAIMFARSLYRNGPSEAAQDWAKRLGLLYRASLNKYWVDELYHAVLVRPLRFLADICYRVADMIFVDGLGVYGTANLVGGVGNRVRAMHNGDVRRYLLALVVGVGIVLASLYANPTISNIGRSKLNPGDAGGLRPTLGPQPVELRLLGRDEPFLRLGPERDKKKKQGDKAPKQGSKAPGGGDK
jgi:NADH-quinone oxidoreductase subunit L